MEIDLATGALLPGIMVRHRVVIHDGVDASRPWSTGSGIVSRVPDVRIEAQGTGYSTRARFLSIQEGEHRVDFRAHLLRPPVGGWRAPESSRVIARGAAGRGVTVALADPAVRAIRPLVDLSRLEVTRCDVGDPERLLARWLIEGPLQAILGTDGDPIVGPEVRTGIRNLFVFPVPMREKVILNHELSYIERIRCGTVRLPELMARRLREITGRLARLESVRSPSPMTDMAVECQVDRLGRMVRDRACSAIWFRRGEIRGVLNPAPDAQPGDRPPMEFLVKMDPETYPGWVYTWTLGTSQRSAPRCLGTGFSLLQEFERTRDVFSILDVLLNYVENNPTVPRRRRAQEEVFLDAFDLLDALEHA